MLRAALGAWPSMSWEVTGALHAEGWPHHGTPTLGTDDSGHRGSLAAAPIAGGSDGTTSSSTVDDSEFPVFSPSETELWLRCPMLHRYQHSRKLVARAEEWQPHRLLGNAIHAALAKHYVGEPEGEQLEAASLTLEQEFVEQDEWTKEGLYELITKGLKVARQTPLLGPGDKVVAAEKLFLRGKSDLIFRTPGGVLGVWDHKVKLELDSRYRDKTLKEFSTGWQFRHYAWSSSEHYGYTGDIIGGIHLIQLTPRPKAYQHEIPLTRTQILQWLESAKRVWRQMADNKPWMNTLSCERPWRCAFHEACHDLAGDETRFDALYERREG